MSHPDETQIREAVRTFLRSPPNVEPVSFTVYGLPVRGYHVTGTGVPGNVVGYDGDWYDLEPEQYRYDPETGRDELLSSRTAVPVASYGPDVSAASVRRALQERAATTQVDGGVELAMSSFVAKRAQLSSDIERELEETLQDLADAGHPGAATILRYEEVPVGLFGRRTQWKAVKVGYGWPMGKKHSNWSSMPRDDVGTTNVFEVYVDQNATFLAVRPFEDALLDTGTYPDHQQPTGFDQLTEVLNVLRGFLSS